MAEGPTGPPVDHDHRRSAGRSRAVRRYRSTARLPDEGLNDPTDHCDEQRGEEDAPAVSRQPVGRASHGPMTVAGALTPRERRREMVS